MGLKSAPAGGDCRGPSYLFGGAWGGVVVDDEDLVDLRHRFKSLNRCRDAVFFVVGRQNDANCLITPHVSALQTLGLEQQQAFAPLVVE